MSDVFKAIADPTRREILLSLAAKSGSIGEIAENFNMTRPAIAKHIKILENANLVGIETDSTDGRQRNCYARLEALKEVEDYIGQLEKFWKAKLGGLNDYLTKKNE